MCPAAYALLKSHLVQVLSEFNQWVNLRPVIPFFLGGKVGLSSFFSAC